MGRIPENYRNIQTVNIVQIFNSIRDIPYRIPLSWEDKSLDCIGKHNRLAEALSEKGYKVRLRTCTFRWSDLNIPEKILKIPHKDECKHLFLEMFIDNKWITLDVTWDSDLRNILKVNEWDGASDTEIAVKPIKIFSPSEIHTETKESFQKDMQESGAFYKAFNEWLEEART